MDENVNNLEQKKQKSVNAFYSQVSNKPASSTKKATNNLMYGGIGAVLGILIAYLTILLAFLATLITGGFGAHVFSIIIFVVLVIVLPIFLYKSLMKMIRNWTSNIQEIDSFKIMLLIFLLGGLLSSFVMALIIR